MFIGKFELSELNSYSDPCKSAEKAQFYLSKYSGIDFTMSTVKQLFESNFTLKLDTWKDSGHDWVTTVFGNENGNLVNFHGSVLAPHMFRYSGYMTCVSK